LNEENVWGDFLSRWGSKATDQESAVVSKKVMRLVSTAPLKKEDFEWQPFEEIARIQDKYKEPNEKIVHDPVNKCWMTKHGRVWIPDEAVDLKQRLCVMAHVGLAGHRGINTTVKVLQAVFA
jgi:hypothetical protein